MTSKERDVGAPTPIYNVPVDTDRMRFVSKMYKEGSEAEVFLFNGAAQIEELLDELTALRTAHEAAQAEITRLSGAWTNAHDRCPQCGTGNPRIAELQAKIAALIAAANEKT